MTKGLLVVFYAGQYRIAQYQNSDAYPDWAGLRILEFLQRWDRDKFCRNLLRVHLVDKQDESNVPEDALSWAEALDFVQNAEDGGEDIRFCSSLSFAANSLFCEWVYVIDLEANAFEVYGCRNHFPVPHEQRFAEQPVRMLYKQDYLGQKQYFHVRFLRAWSLRKLPLPDNFVSACLRAEKSYCKKQDREMRVAGRKSLDSL